MAELEEIGGITSAVGWLEFTVKVRGACTIEAAELVDAEDAAPTTVNAGLLAWAKAAVERPEAAAERLVMYIIGTNNAASVAAMLSASKAAILSNVKTAVSVLYKTS